MIRRGRSLFVLAICLIVASLPVHPADAATLEVPGDFLTIQEALDAAAPRDTVRIAPGEYLESIVVREDSVIVTGENAALTRIRGFSGSTVIVSSLAAGDVITGLTLRPAPGVATTFLAAPGSTPRLAELVIEGGTIGLRAQGASPVVESSVIRDCSIGISADSNGSGLFTGNIVSDNLLAISISSGATPAFHLNRLERNTIFNLQVSSFTGAAELDMTSNWWGTADETALVATIRRDASADEVDVQYIPWCGTADCLVVATTPLTWGALRQRF